MATHTMNQHHVSSGYSHCPKRSVETAQRLLWLLILLLSIQGGLRAQQESIVSVPNLLSAVAVTTPSAIVRNIGQNQHIATIRFAGGGCVAGDVDIQFERSSNPTAGGAVWIPFGVKLSTIDASLADLIYAYGPAEGTRINPAAFDTVNCTLTVDYIGTIHPGQVDPALSSAGFQRASIDTAAAGDSVIAAARPGLAVCVYEMVFWNAAAKTVQFWSNPAGTQIDGDYILPVNVGFVLDEQSSFPRFCTVSGQSFVINLSAATQLTGWVHFRYE